MFPSSKGVYYQNDRGQPHIPLEDKVTTSLKTRRPRRI